MPTTSPNPNLAAAVGNGRKRLLGVIPITTSAVATLLPTTYPDGSPVPQCPCICFQPTVDCWIELTSGATALTAATSTHPGVKVLTDQQEYQYNSGDQTKIDVLGSAAGQLNLFVVLV